MRSKASSYLFCIQIVLIATSAIAQKELKFEIINQTQGLSSNSVSPVLQDSRGFLWFGTGDGLNKYDGIEIELIQFSPNHAIISCLYESRDSSLWVGIVGYGLVKYNPTTQESRVYYHNTTDDSGPTGNKVTFIHEDINGCIWVSTNRGGVDRLDFKTGKFTMFSSDRNGLSSDNVSHFFEDSNGNIWVGTLEGALNLFEATENSFKQIVLANSQYNTINEIFQDQNKRIWVGSSGGLYELVKESDSGEFTANKEQTIDDVNALWEDNYSNLWVASNHQLWTLDEATNRFIKKGRSKSRVLPAQIDRKGSIFQSNYMYQLSANSSPILVDDQNNFWIITSEGLNIFDPETLSDKEIRVDDQFTNITSNQINMSMMDRSGSLWFGTSGGGICKFNNSNFNHYQYKKSIKNTLGSAFVLGFHENEDGTIWVTTSGGNLSLFDPRSESFKSIKITNSQSMVFDILPVNDNLWISTSGDGLVRFNPNNLQFKFYKNNPEDYRSIRSDNVQRVLIDKHGKYWVATDIGLNIFDPHTGSFQLIDLQAKNSVQPDVFTIMEEGDYLWLGTLGQGLIKLHSSNHSDYKYFEKDNSNDKSLPNNSITSIYRDPDDQYNLWLGTYGGGLVKFNRSAEEFESFSTQEGLPNNVIYGILEDYEGFLWFSSNAGISKFDKKNERIVANYDLDDGLQSNEFNRGAYLKLKNGSMLFGGINGFNLFDPKKVTRTEFTPSVHFTNFKIFGEENTPIKADLLSGKSNIDLKYTQNFFSIEFATLDYRNPKRNQYKYRLIGLTRDWTEASNLNTFATYTNLDAGEYVFELMATNSDGNWLTESRKLNITIHPPFWETSWFRILAVIIFAGMILSIHFSRVRGLQRQRARLNQLVRERTKTIDDQNIELSKKNKELENTVHKLRETHAHLVESKKMASLGVLSAGVGHEINNPLNFIKGGIQGLFRIIKKKMDVDPRIEKFVDIVNEGVDRTSAIVESLGHFSKSSSEMTEKCQLPLIISNCLILLEHNTKNRINVMTHFEPDELIVSGNAGRLHQAFLNILSNAVQAIEGEGSITIHGKLIKDEIQISIHDDGVGIDTTILPQVMDPFFTTKAPGKGTGLGLSITFHIINEHEGDIEILSEPNKGTNVIVKFPIIQNNRNHKVA